MGWHPQNVSQSTVSKSIPSAIIIIISIRCAPKSNHQIVKNSPEMNDLELGIIAVIFYEKNI